MPVSLRKHSSRVQGNASERSKRMKELNDEAAEIRDLHIRGKISDKEAQQRLHQLKTRYRSFIDRLLAVY